MLTAYFPHTNDLASSKCFIFSTMAELFFFKAFLSQLTGYFMHYSYVHFPTPIITSLTEMGNVNVISTLLFLHFMQCGMSHYILDPDRQFLDRFKIL